MDRYTYKAKSMSEELWITGYLSKYKDKYIIEDIHLPERTIVIPHTISQYIGILDKENTPLCEWDLVKREAINHQSGGKGIYIIRWNPGYAMFGLYNPKTKMFDTDYHNRFYKIIPKNILRVGSVFTDQTYWDLMKDEIMSININNK